MRGIHTAAFFLAVLAGIAPPATAQPITVDEAIQTALKANASLPVAESDVRITQQRQLEAEAARRLRLALEGDFIYAPPNGYDPVITNSGEERFQLAGDTILYTGHGSQTTVSKERDTNPFLTGAFGWSG